SSIAALPDSTRAEASDGRGLGGWIVERHGAMSAPHDFVIYEAIIAPRDREFWLMAAFSGWGLLKWCWPLRCPSGFPRCDVGVIGFWSAHTFYPHPAICPLWAFPAATREEPDPTPPHVRCACVRCEAVRGSMGAVEKAGISFYPPPSLSLLG